MSWNPRSTRSALGARAASPFVYLRLLAARLEDGPAVARAALLYALADAGCGVLAFGPDAVTRLATDADARVRRAALMAVLLDANLSRNAAAATAVAVAALVRPDPPTRIAACAVLEGLGPNAVSGALESAKRNASTRSPATRPSSRIVRAWHSSGVKPFTG